MYSCRSDMRVATIIMRTAASPFSSRLHKKVYMRYWITGVPSLNIMMTSELKMDSYDCMQSIHPGQKLTEEVVKYAIHKEEYLGVLGKEYTAEEEENRLF